MESCSLKGEEECVKQKGQNIPDTFRTVATTGKHVNLLIYGHSHTYTERSLADSLTPQAGKNVWTESASTRPS